jgi:hypothetical protein
MATTGDFTLAIDSAVLTAPMVNAGAEAARTVASRATRVEL